MQDIANGAFIMRAQPLHNGHIEMIKYMYRRCRKCVILLGSANKANEMRNPLPIELREQILIEALEELGIAQDIKVIRLNDWSAEDDYGSANVWGRFLYFNIANTLNTRNITFFYSDAKEIMLSWFRGTEIEKYIDYCFVDRKQVADGVSATAVRKQIIEENQEYLARYCPSGVQSRMLLIKKYLDNSTRNLPGQ